MRRVMMIALFVGMSFCLCDLISAEDLKVFFDTREWRVGYSAENQTQGITEYVLKDESVQLWTELVTVQAFFELQNKITPEAYMDGMVDILKKTCPDIRWKVLRKDRNDMLFEWEIAACPGQVDQYEIDRIIAGQRAIYVVHYATKKLPVSFEKRDYWAKLLDSAELVNAQ